MYFDDSNGENFLWGWEQTVKKKESGAFCFEKIACNKLQIDEELYLQPQVRNSLVDQLTTPLLSDENFLRTFAQKVGYHIDLMQCRGSESFTAYMAERIVDYLCNTQEPELLEKIERRIREHRLRRFSEAAEEADAIRRNDE